MLISDGVSNDKLLGRIEEQAINRAGSLADYEAGLLTRTSERAIARQMAKINWMKRQLSAWNALRAVVELHKPIISTAYPESLGICLTCSPPSLNFYEATRYPCPTIQAIEAELK